MPNVLWPRRSANRRRLEALIKAYALQLDWRAAEAGDDVQWIRTARELLTAGESALQERNREKAWTCVLAALRFEVFGFAPAELEAGRVALRHEAEAKLGSWRRDAVVDLLSRQERLMELMSSLLGEAAAREAVSALEHNIDESQAQILGVLRARGGDLAEPLGALLIDAAAERIGTGSEADDRLRLFHALQIRDEHSANVQRQVSLLRLRLIATSTVLILALACILALAAWKPLVLSERPAGTQTWAWVLLFGTLGGCLTALLSAGGPGAARRFPEQQSAWLVAAARPLVGGAAALFAYALFAAGILRIGTGETAAALLALAFVAGFSERLVAGAAASIAGRDTERPK